MTTTRARRATATNKEMLWHIHELLHSEEYGLAAHFKAQLARDKHLHDLLHEINERTKKIMTTQAELVAQSEALMAKVTETRDAQEALKIYVQGIKDQVTQLAQDLADAIANGSSPAVLQQVSDNLTAAAEGIDAVEAGEAAMQNTTP